MPEGTLGDVTMTADAAGAVLRLVGGIVGVAIAAVGQASGGPLARDGGGPTSRPGPR